MRQIARLTVLMLLSTIIIIIGALVQSKFVSPNNKSIFWSLWGTSMIFGFSVWVFLESYYDLRFSPGKEGKRGTPGQQGAIGLRGRCNYPKYVGPLKTKKGIKIIDWIDEHFVKLGPLKQAAYRTKEWLSGSNSGRVEGHKINGRPINFRRCQKLCNSTKDCKSFHYYAKKDMNKRTGDTYEDKACIFYNKTCNDAGKQCEIEKINLANVIDKDIIGLHEKQ